MARPTFILVPGAWHSAEFYDRVIAILKPLGYKCVALNMPSVGRSPPVSSLDEDINTVRSAVWKELELGNNVVVSAHSWGGIPATSALDGLSKSERQQDGKTSSVIKLAFVSALVVPVGGSLKSAVHGPPPPHVDSSWIVSEEGQVVVPGFLPMLYHDLDPEDAKYWVSRLKPHSFATFLAEAPFAAHLKIPLAYFICENDQAIPIQGQEAMIADARAAGANVETERHFVAHSPHLTKSNEVAEFLRRAAGEPV